MPRGELVATGPAFDLTEVLVGFGREGVEPPLRQVVELGLEDRAGRIELACPHGPKTHRHAGSGVGLGEGAGPPDRHRARDAVRAITTGEELADPERRERLRDHEWVAEPFGDLQGRPGLLVARPTSPP